MADPTAPERLLDPDCRDGKCGSCIGGPCEHDCHTPPWMLEDAGIGRPKRTPPDDTTAPVTAEGLREVAAQAIRDANGTPEARAWWERHQAIIPAHVYADAVLAALAGDPGDLPAQMATEMRRHRLDERSDDEPGLTICVCGEQVVDFKTHWARVAMSVRWEDHAATVARLAQAEARAEHAEGELQVRRDRRERWAHERALREEAEAAIERVKAIPPTPQDTDIDATVNRIYRQGWESVIDAIDRALAAPDAPTEETDRV